MEERKVAPGYAGRNPSPWGAAPHSCGLQLRDRPQPTETTVLELLLYKWTRTHLVSALYVPAGMEENVRSIVTASEAAGVFTLAGSPIDVERGLVIGLRVSAGSKKLVVNMAAAERAGVDFDAVVRQVALRRGNTPAKKDRDELRQTLVRYTEAIQERDLDAPRGVWPALEGDDEKRIVASFKMARSHTIFFAVLRIEHQGEKAQARVRRTDKLVTRDGQRLPREPSSRSRSPRLATAPGR